jgi:hypothetical protein
MIGNHVYPQGYRGFESLSLRNALLGKTQPSASGSNISPKISLTGRRSSSAIAPSRAWGDKCFDGGRWWQRRRLGCGPCEARVVGRSAGRVIASRAPAHLRSPRCFPCGKKAEAIARVAHRRAGLAEGRSSQAQGRDPLAHRKPREALRSRRRARTTPHGWPSQRAQAPYVAHHTPAFASLAYHCADRALY